jgi:activator of 2-hydroxyglutaryl-CoA dehydratase
MVSLVARSVQLMKRVKLEREVTLVGGIMRFPTMVRVLREQLGMDVNVPPEPLAQFAAAMGAAVLGRQRLEKAAATA